MPTIKEFLGSFVPLFLIPIDAYPSLVLGLITLFFANYTLTYPTRSRRTWTRFNISIPTLIRLILFPIGISYFYDYGFGAYDTPSHSVILGVSVVGLYGMMRMVETCLVSLLDEEAPRWVKRFSEEGAVRDQLLPLPKSFWGRMAYAFDLTTSLRGNSWFSGIYWDWCPPSLVPKVAVIDNGRRKHVGNGKHTIANGDTTSTSHETSWGDVSSRMNFVKDKAIWIVIQFLIVDVFDTMNKSRSWHLLQVPMASSSPNDTQQLLFKFNRYPITSQPPLIQIALSISVCTYTLFAITTQYDLISMLTVLFTNSDPKNWPPMFDYPFEAKSLNDFWGKRWHMIFKRVFDRLARPFERIVGGPAVAVTDVAMPAKKDDMKIRINVRKTLRAILIFSLTTILHILLMWRITLRHDPRLKGDPMEEIYSLPIFDVEIFKFFLLQPFLLLVEYVVIKPLFSRVLFASSPYASTNAVRIWAWCALIWTGRYWSDVWVARGLWMEREKVVGFSLLRGVFNGGWIV